MKAELAKNPGRIVGRAFLVLLFLMVPIAAVVLAAHRWMPTLASEHGAGIDTMIKYLVITIGALLIVGHLVLAYFIWRFSGKDRVTFRMANAKTEWKWALIPVIAMTLIAEGGVLMLGMPVWREFYAAKAPADAITVEVTAEQFAWNVRYPGRDGVFGRSDFNLFSKENPLGLDENDPTAKDDIFLGPELRLPVNKPVRIILRSKDVLHSFFLPHQRVKQDAVPGMAIELWFIPTQIGEFEIACAELCGLGHYKMRGILTVLSQQDFEKWLNEESTQSLYF